MDSTTPVFALTPVGQRPVRSIAAVVAGCGVLTLGFLSGCMTENASYLVSHAPPPAPLAQSVNAMAQEAGTAPKSGAFSPFASAETSIVVTQVPRFPQKEVIRPAPSYRHVWLAGYWTWLDEGYQWVEGHWEQPPGTSSVWIRPRWTRNGDSYRFYEGHWD